MMLLPENILKLIKLWRRSGRNSVSRMWKSGVDLVKSASEGETHQGKGSLLYKFIMLELHSTESKWMFSDNFR